MLSFLFRNYFFLSNRRTLQRKEIKIMKLFNYEVTLEKKEKKKLSDLIEEREMS